MRGIFRPLLVGLLLIPLCCYWAQDQVIDRIFSLMVPPLALTIVLALLNLLVRRALPKLALSGGEIAVVYAMLTIACAMSGEWMDMVGPSSYGFAIYSEQNPRYGTYILPYVHDWFFFRDPKPLKEFAEGGKSFAYFTSHLYLWWPKIGAWTLLLTLVTTAMLCISALLKDQWVHKERLAFPLVQLPIALTEESGPGQPPLWKSKLFWGAFVVVFAIDMLNGLSFLYPQLPHFNIRFIRDFNKAFVSPPWNQTGWTPIGIFPYLSALGFLMPTDLLFSLLVFFFVRKAQQIIAYTIGNEQGTFGGGGLTPSPPYFSEQSWGAFLGLFVSALWLARPHLKALWRQISTGERDPGGGFPARSLFVLLVACVAGTAAIGVAIGLPLPFVLLYVALFLAFSVAVTRLRASLGAPTHEMAFMGPHQLVLDFHGSAGLSNELLTRTLATFHFMNRIHRTHPMPSLMEGLYLADRNKLSARGMFLALFLAIPLGTVGGFLAHIYFGYRYTPVSWVSGELGGFVSNILSTPRPPNPAAMLAVVGGFATVMLLDFIRFRIPGFWLHPAGYALAMNFGVDYYWFGLLIVLIVKVFVQRFYGLRGYGQLRQLAFGLVVGEFMAELIWATFSMLNDRQMTYSISINGKMSWDQ